MGFFRQEYWSELPFPPPGDLPYPGVEPASLVSSALAGGFFTTAPAQKGSGVWTYDHIIRSVPKWKNTSGTPGEKINGPMSKELKHLKSLTGDVCLFLLK